MCFRPIKNRSKDAFPSDTKKNPKDCMVGTLRSGRELESIKEDDKKKTEKEEKEETGEETKLSSSELAERLRKKRCRLGSRWRKEN